MAYHRTRGVALRCTDYSESSQVVAFITPDLGQVHVLAKGSRRPRRDGRVPLDLLNHCDLVLAMRTPGQLHILTEWVLRENFVALRTSLGRLWAACCAAEVVLLTTSENPEDGAVCEELLFLLRRLGRGEDEAVSFFRFISGALRTVGAAPVLDRCAQCGGTLIGQTHFSPAAGGALCAECGRLDPAAFVVSRGALAAMTRLSSRGEDLSPLRLSGQQRWEIQRAFNEQIQYHLGRPLRTARFMEALYSGPGGLR